MRLKGRRIAVVGLGISGRAAASLALHEGAEVAAVDTRAHLEAPEGVARWDGPWEALLPTVDTVVVSPGVAAAHPAIAAAVDAGVDVVGELGFADRLTDLPWIGVTGTNGKSTVTSFVGTLLAAAGRRAFVGGNLGIPLSEAVGGDWDIGVVEVSSYQLELPGEVAPPAAVWLNLTPDHLTRHGDMAGYAAAKAALFTRQQPTDLALLGPGAHIAAAMADAPGRRVHLGQGVRVVGRRAEIDLGAGRVSLDLSRVSVPGRHNLEHAATAAALCLEMGVPVEALAAGLAELEALPHRMQPVATRDDVVWIDDSKATNIASASVAIRGLDRAAVVLLGGRSKGPGFAVLADDLRRHRAVLAFGEAGADIAAELVEAGLGVERVDAMETAMQRAAELAQPGDAVLLSPACSSFDAYDDFAHRGRRFTELARGGMP